MDLDTKIIIFLGSVITVVVTIIYSYIIFENNYYIKPLYEPIKQVVSDNRNKMDQFADDERSTGSIKKGSYVIWIEGELHGFTDYELENRFKEIYFCSKGFPTIEEIRTVVIIKPSLKQTKSYLKTTTKKSPLSAKQSYTNSLELNTYLLEIWLIDIIQNQIYAYRRFEPEDLGKYYNNGSPGKSKFWEARDWLEQMGKPTAVHSFFQSMSEL